MQHRGWHLTFSHAMCQLQPTGALIARYGSRLPVVLGSNTPGNVGSSVRNNTYCMVFHAEGLVGMELYYRLEQYNACMHHNIPTIGCISVHTAQLTVISDQPVIKNTSLTFLMMNQPHSLPMNHPTMSLTFSQYYYFCITVHITFLLQQPLCRELYCRHTLLILLLISSSAETL